jgi:large subunit ribosomal protein L9
MQIILLEKVANLGNLGTVVHVKNGYARNFLIPQKKARRATPQNIAEIEARRTELEAEHQKKFDEAKALGERLNGMTIQIVQKAGLDGRLFGSVGSADISEALKAEGFSIERRYVRMPNGLLKQIGNHPIAIGLHTDVVVDITVSVLGDTSI